MMCTKVFIRGVLKGVGYLAYVYIVASRLGIKGCARYIDDGVEVIAIGDNNTIEKFVNLLKHHNTMAIINEIRIERCSNNLSINVQEFDIDFE